MPLRADLYVDRIDLAKHLGPKTCGICRVDSLAEFVDRLQSGELRPGQCPHWSRQRIEAFRMAVDAGRVLPAIPSLDVPRPAEAGLFDLNGPGEYSPLLITGNSRLTHDVLLAVLSSMADPMWVLAVETNGHTVDMSLVYKTLTPEGIVNALQAGDWRRRGFQGRIILPGLAESLAAPAAKMLGRPVEAGPICAAELPLFFAQDDAS